MAESRDPGKRRFPRARERIPVQLTLDDGKRRFKATVYTVDISLTGVFFSTKFYLKTGMMLDLEFKMPNDDRVVRTRGIIIREVRLDERQKRSKLQSGFAMRFIEYHADAKAVLAASFMIAELDEFISDYLYRRSKKPKNEKDQLRDVVIAWEVGKMELKGGELDLMRDRIQVDSEGKIRRKKRR